MLQNIALRHLFCAQPYKGKYAAKAVYGARRVGEDESSLLDFLDSLYTDWYNGIYSKW